MTSISETLIEIKRMAQFEHAALNLLQQINSDPCNQEAVNQFLQSFAEHVVWHVVPASGSSILQYQGLTMKEIAQRLPDMDSSAQLTEQDFEV